MGAQSDAVIGGAVAEASPSGPTARVRAALGGRLFAYTLIAPALIVLVLAALVPFLYAAWISLHETAFTDIEGWAGLSNYGELLSEGAFWHAMGISALIVVVAVPLELALGLGIAMAFHRGVLGGRVLSPLFLIPSIIVPTVVAITWKVMLAGSWGLVTQTVFEPLHILSNSSVFGDSTTALIAIIFIDVWQWTPFVALAFFAGLQAQPENPYRAAAVDGANGWQTFRHITAPLLYPLFAVLLLLRVIDTFKLFDTVFILTNGGPGDATETASIFLQRQGFDFFNVGLAAAAAVVIFVLFFVLATIAYRLFVNRLRLF